MASMECLMDDVHSHSLNEVQKKCVICQGKVKEFKKDYGIYRGKIICFECVTGIWREIIDNNSSGFGDWYNAK